MGEPKARDTQSNPIDERHNPLHHADEGTQFLFQRLAQTGKARWPRGKPNALVIVATHSYTDFEEQAGSPGQNGDHD